MSLLTPACKLLEFTLPVELHLFLLVLLVVAGCFTENIMVYQSGSRLGPAYSNLMKINMDAIQLLKAVEKSS